MKRVISLLGMSVVCAQAFTHEVDLSLNADALRLQYIYDMKSTVLDLDAGWLYSENHGDAVHIGINLADLASSGPDKIVAGVGGRVVYTHGDLSKQSGFAVPIGGFVRYTPQTMDRLTVGGSLYYAPSILAISDMEKYQEYTVRIVYNVVRAADIYIGARYVRGDYKNAPDARFDTGMNIGFTLRF